MSADTIQAKYDQLEMIAKRFGQQVQAQGELQRRVGRNMQALQNGGWQGLGSAAFFAEMNSTVHPSLLRLIAALQEAQVTTQTIKAILETAETEAANPFRGGQGVDPVIGPASTSSRQSAGVQQNGGQATGGGSIWDNLRPSGKIWEFDNARRAGTRQGGKFEPGLNLSWVLAEGAVWGKPREDGMSAIGGSAEVGLRANLKDGVMIGAGGEYYTAKGQWDTAMVGNKEYGVTGGMGVKTLSAEGFGGVRFDRKDQRIGATIGANAISVDGNVGANVAGYNVSVTGEAGLKAELGFEVGRKGVEVKLPFVSVGLKFGGGVD